MSLKYFLLAFVAPILMVVIYYDYKWRRIPNFITVPLIIFGFMLQFIIGGWTGCKSSLMGLFIGSGVFFLLYLSGGMGAGDVKLMGGTGALLGVDKIFAALILIIFIGGLMAIIKIVKRTLCSKSKDKLIFRNWFSKEGCLSNNKDNMLSKSETIPYGIAISIGTLITIFLY